MCIMGVFERNVDFICDVDGMFDILEMNISKWVLDFVENFFLVFLKFECFGLFCVVLDWSEFDMWVRYSIELGVWFEFFIVCILYCGLY